MINLKKHTKYAIFVIIFITIILISYIGYKNDEVYARSDEKTSSIVKMDESDKDDVVADIKGAVVKPGVYSLSSGKRIIDLVNKAGGLTDDAYTININLSKKIEDEMVVIIYTKDEILNYKKDTNDTSEIKCVKEECICPNTNNSGCINKTTTNKTTKKKTTSKNKNAKVSINTATKEELMTLTGIGEAKANAIIAYRNENGNFNNIEDIKKVSGIGDSLFEKIKNNITL